MKGVAEVQQICQSGKGLCLIVIFLMLLLQTRLTVAHSVRSSADPALAGTRGSDISENAGGKEPAISSLENNHRRRLQKCQCYARSAGCSALRTGLTRGRVRAAFVGMRSPVLDRE